MNTLPQIPDWLLGCVESSLSDLSFANPARPVFQELHGVDAGLVLGWGVI
jgi:hypothetical protein